ncbi:MULTISPECIES: AIR synthase related protein [unclassified Amycolatopsis]|uniref:AIR synthase related protein n=1 Tax=unclassified Amycolatopsis TaxID=2618356 RepID=UPI0028742BED|nr:MULTISPECIES: AIR synthase related protein [unclassified Amycolatopsis]MDS0134671.1 hypothetical protein [Amycolatopsis sp. 505]MDS0147430.1 hypothetical protein [Amycolatopsis sp. CM201R]
MTTIDPERLTCPLPGTETERILLGHGSGGRLMADLITTVIAGELGERGPLEDAALVGADLVVSTDGFVVTPRFFPGGDIGSLAVYGTVNDLAMRGARPVALTLAYVLEEGLPLAEQLSRNPRLPGGHDVPARPGLARRDDRVRR